MDDYRLEMGAEMGSREAGPDVRWLNKGPSLVTEIQTLKFGKKRTRRRKLNKQTSQQTDKEKVTLHSKKKMGIERIQCHSFGSSDACDGFKWNDSGLRTRKCGKRRLKLDTNLLPGTFSSHANSPVSICSALGEGNVP